MNFDEFARSRLPALLRFATVLCGDAGLAEDVVQDVLARAYSRWARIEAVERPEAYVRRMIVNEFVSWRRKWARITPQAELPEPRPGRDHAEIHAEQADLMERLSSLPPRQRAVVVLRYYEDLSDEQIAAELGCAPGTVRSNLSRALATLRVRMAAPHRDEAVHR